MSIKIEVQASDDDTWKKDGVRYQRLYIHGLTSGKYPERVSRRLDDGDQLLPPGVYQPNGYKIDWGKVIVDYDKLAPVAK
jgi:hypothetical protein